jgi:Transposase domain (DUF772)
MTTTLATAIQCARSRRSWRISTSPVRGRARSDGRPGYHPSVLLRLYIYGYLNRISSSRCIEREAGRNLEVIWLLGRLAPDDKVIAATEPVPRTVLKHLTTNTPSY